MFILCVALSTAFAFAVALHFGPTRRAIHGYTAEPDVRPGDVWVAWDASPWNRGHTVLDVKDGWVKTDGAIERLRDFVAWKVMKSRKDT